MVHGFVLLLEVGSLRCVYVGEDVDDCGRVAPKPFEGAVELDRIVPGRRKHWWNDRPHRASFSALLRPSRGDELLCHSWTCYAEIMVMAAIVVMLNMCKIMMMAAIVQGL